MRKNKLSVVLATRNEEKNIAECLESVKNIADEIVIYDEKSEDKTVEIAKKYAAKVFSVNHEDNFHITKQKALDAAKGDWILQLDADERITPELSKEITEVINMSDVEIKNRKYPKNKNRILKKHESILKQTGKWNEDGEVVAFWIPRLNYFLGKPLRYAGVYPDPAIRLVKKGKTRFPMKSVHEFMDFDGATAWLFNDMKHVDSPTLERYLSRLNRYTDLQAKEHKKNHVGLNVISLLNYSLIKPILVFLKMYIRNKGFLEGLRGFVWCAFSASHYPISYFKYYINEESNN